PGPNPGGSVQQYVVDRNAVGLARIAKGLSDIAEVVAGKLKQADCLTIAVERRSTVIGGPHIASEIGTTGTGTGYICDRLRPLRLGQHRMRSGEVVQPGN